MNEAKQLVNKALACKMKNDNKGAAEFYAKAIEIGKKNDPKNPLILDWYYAYGYCFYYLNDYETNKKIGLEYIVYAENLQDYTNLQYAYQMVHDAIYYIPNYDEEEYNKYGKLLEEVKVKVLEKQTQELEAIDPITNSLKAKTVLMAINPKSIITKQFTEKDVEAALSLNMTQLMSNDFLRNMENIAKQLVLAVECLNVKRKNSVEEGNAWKELAFYGCTVSKFLSYDSELGNLCVLFFEKSYEILVKIDKLGKDLILMLATAESQFSSFPSLEAIGEKYKKMGKDITDQQIKESKDKEKKINEKLNELEDAKENMEERVTKMELEQKILGEKFEKLQTNVNLVQENLSSHNEKLTELGKQKENMSDMSLIGSLLAKEKALLEKKAALKKICDNPDLSDYYNSMMQQLETVYIGARAAASGSVQASKSTKFSDAAGYATNFIEMIPMMGKIFSTVVSNLAKIGDAFTNTKDKLKLVNIGEISSNITIFNEFSEEIVFAYIKKNENQILAYKEAKLNEKEWKNMLKAAVGGIEGFFEKILKENDSKAKLQGKSDSAKIITYLQKGYIKIKPGEDYEKYVTWVLEEKEFKQTPVNSEKPKKKPTGCFCFCRSKAKVENK